MRDPIPGLAAEAGARSAPVGHAGGYPDGRAEVLARIGRALKRDAPSLDTSVAPEAVRVRLGSPGRHTQPFVGEDLVGRAVRLMEDVLMDVVRLQVRGDVPEAMRDWLAGHGQNGAVTVAPALHDIAFPDDYPLTVRRGTADGVESTGLTPCIAAVAETGSVVFASTADTPATLNFLPENHVVVLHENQLVAHVDDVFPQLRGMAKGGAPMPRAVNFVTGPSRTADVEQTLEIGAHGPKRMLVLLLPGDAPSRPDPDPAMRPASENA